MREGWFKVRAFIKSVEENFEHKIYLDDECSEALDKHIKESTLKKPTKKRK